MACAELGQLDDARRCIDDAIDKVERSKEKWCEAEVNRVAGEVALKSPAPDTEKDIRRHYHSAFEATTGDAGATEGVCGTGARKPIIESCTAIGHNPSKFGQHGRAPWQPEL
jgi:hypothetical protein